MLVCYCYEGHGHHQDGNGLGNFMFAMENNYFN